MLGNPRDCGYSFSVVNFKNQAWMLISSLEINCKRVLYGVGNRACYCHPIQCNIIGIHVCTVLANFEYFVVESALFAHTALPVRVQTGGSLTLIAHEFIVAVLAILGTFLAPLPVHVIGKCVA